MRDRVVARAQPAAAGASTSRSIAKVEADAHPVIWLAFTSDTLTPLQITDLVNRIVKPRLQTVPGVADVRIYGERKYAMRVWLDPRQARRLPPDHAGRRGRAAPQNLEVPAGRIESAAARIQRHRRRPTWRGPPSSARS